MCMACLVAAVAAAPAAAIDDDQVLADLAHGDYAIREKATARLLIEPQIADAQIDRLFARTTTAEQRHRLLDVARHHLLLRARRDRIQAGQRGSIGVQIQDVAAYQLPGRKQPAIYIARTLPGFPGYGRLYEGDLIMAINGDRPVGLQGDEITQFLQNRISRMAPDAPVQLTIQRDGEERDLIIHLAPLEALSQMYMPSPVIGAGLTLPLTGEYEALWRHRRRQMLDRIAGAG